VNDRNENFSPQCVEEETSIIKPGLRISSEVLLSGKKELIIEHAGEDYRLRITSKGKLILTKP